MLLISKFIKFGFFIIAIIVLLLLLFPAISLFVPAKLTNHVYYRLLYHIIATKETRGYSTEEARALKLMQYVNDHTFSRGTPYKCKPAESLMYGEAYCDFQARVLNVLLGVVGVPCRYAMLLDKDGVSPHTLNEVFLHNKWCVFDTAMHIIFKDDSGNMVSLKEMSDNPDIIYRSLVAKGYSKSQCDGNFAWYSRMFPVPLAPRRSQPTMYKFHILDYILDTYFKIFKDGFFNFYQDVYLRLNKEHARRDDFRIFFMARNYHLAHRKGLALEYYNALLEKYPQSEYVEDIVFFLAMLYFELKDFPKSIEYFKLILDKYPKWSSAAKYYLDKMDKTEAVSQPN